jgi:hypothetical protein
MPIYTPPALNAVNFELTVQPSHSVAPYDIPLSVYSVPALNAVSFALTVYTPPTYNTIDFEFLPSGGSDVTTNPTALFATFSIPAPVISIAVSISPNVLSALFSLPVFSVDIINTEVRRHRMFTGMGQ